MGQAAESIHLHAAPRAVQLSELEFEQLAIQMFEKRLCGATNRGRASGREEATQEGCQRLDAAVELLSAERARLEDEATAFAARFAIDIARTILRRELADGHYEIERIVRETLAQSGVDRGNCVVHLSPQDYASLSTVQFRSGTILEADPAIGRGDVHITTAQGLFVREVDSILRTLAERLGGVALS